MRASTALRLLTGLMYTMGGLALCATAAIAMPTAWMVSTAEWLEVGPLPRMPLVEYLTRSLAAVYALIGALAVYLARDVRRNLDLVVFGGWLTIALGIVLTIVDFGVGMPASWSWGEGPPTVLLGWGFVWLARRAGAPEGRSGSRSS